FSGRPTSQPPSAPASAAAAGSTQSGRPRPDARSSDQLLATSQPIEAPHSGKASRGKGGAVCLSPDRNRSAVNAGLSVSELNAEITVDTAIVSANCRKN